MREFILLALKAKTSLFNVNNLPEEGRMDLVCRTVSNALFISNDVRRDTIIHVVMTGPKYPPKIVSFYGKDLKGINPDEKSIAENINLALEKGKNLKLNEETNLKNGIVVSKKSFEQLVREKSNNQIVYLHKKGEDIRKIKFKDDVVFVLGDYIGMPKKTESLLERFGAKKSNLSPVMLFASHCIIIVHNELDRR